ncbi:MAG: very short patch repair endonuclease [Nitrospiraceae bacterium]|nr:very short patch repair endonuclease [Nitrospiraceae bacterium]
MADIYPEAKRSQIMSRIRARGNIKTELALAKLLRQHRIIGWRRHLKLFGNPDFVFRKYRLAIFVDGCFWHGCPKHASQPTTNRTFWEKKLLRNKDRDRLVTRTLRKLGWHVLRIWQHELTGKSVDRCVSRIRQVLDCSSTET